MGSSGYINATGGGTTEGLNTKPISSLLPRDVIQNIELVMCVPSTGGVSIHWMFGVIQFLACLNPMNCHFIYEARYGVGYSREALYRQALKVFPNFTHLLWLDSDTIPDVVALAQLINDDKPIVGGAIFGDSLSGIDVYIKGVLVKMDYTQKLIQVDRMGLGFCLIKREVLDKTYVLFNKEPIFHLSASTDPRLTDYEDMYFFDKVREIGYRPWVDLRARIIHLKQVGLTPEGSMIPSGLAILGDQYFKPSLTKPGK